MVNIFALILCEILLFVNAYEHRPAWTFTFAVLGVVNAICIIILKIRK